MGAIESWILAILGLAAGAGIILVIVYLLATIIANVVTHEEGPRGNLPNR